MAVTIVPSLPDYTTNDCLDQLAERLRGVPELLAVYDYRELQATTETAASVTSLRDSILDSRDGVDLGYDYLVDVQVKIGDDRRAAERTLNTIVDKAWRAMYGPNLPYWTDCRPFARNDKPGSPDTMSGWRRAILYVRVIPN